MELRDIEYFAVIAEHRNLGRAAEALGLSQPALSMSLRRLEAAMQTKLVKRTPKGIELTAVGTALLSRVQPLRMSIADVAREAADLSEGRAGNVRIGAAPEFAEYFLPPALTQLFAEAPTVSVQVTVAGPDILRDALRNADHDLVITGIASGPYQDLVQLPLFDEGFVLVAATHHRLARKRRIAISDLANERWAVANASVLAWKWLNSVFKEHGLPPPRLAMHSNSALVRLLTIASSEVLGFTSPRFLRTVASHLPLSVIHVPDSTWQRHMGVSYRRDSYMPPAANRLIEILCRIAAKVVAEDALSETSGGATVSVASSRRRR